MHTNPAGDNPLYVFLHMPKCAGTTFVHHVRRNLPRDRNLLIYLHHPNGYYDPTTGLRVTLDSWEQIDERLGALSAAAALRIRVACGHDVFWGMERCLGGGRAVRYVTFLREPVSRTLSWYRMFRRMHEQGIPLDDCPSAACMFGPGGRVRSFREWFRCADHRFPFVTRNNMTRHFMHRFLRDQTPPEQYTEDHLRRCLDVLDTFEIVGTVDSFNAHAARLYEELRFTRRFEDQNRSPRYERAEEIGDLAEEIRERSPLDQALYDYALDRDARGTPGGGTAGAPARATHADRRCPVRPVPDRANSAPLYVFLHTPKCAGTTLTHHFRQHLAPDQALALYLHQAEAYHDPTTGRRETLRSWKQMDERLSALTPAHRNRVRVVYGHDAFLDLGRWFPGREVRFVTFLREPVAVLLSWYKMFRRVLQEEGSVERFGLSASRMLDDRGVVRSFQDWFLATEAVYPELTRNNTTKHFARRFLRDGTPHERCGVEQLATCKAALDACHRVGTVATFTRHAEQLCRELELPAVMEEQNYSPKYVTPEELGAFARVVRTRNALDQALYEHARVLDPLAEPV